MQRRAPRTAAAWITTLVERRVDRLRWRLVRPRAPTTPMAFASTLAGRPLHHLVYGNEFCHAGRLGRRGMRSLPRRFLIIGYSPIAAEAHLVHNVSGGRLPQHIREDLDLACATILRDGGGPSAAVAPNQYLLFPASCSPETALAGQCKLWQEHGSAQTIDAISCAPREVVAVRPHFGILRTRRARPIAVRKLVHQVA